MIVPSRNQFPTTAMEIAEKTARQLLESEPRPAFDLADYYIRCTNPDAPAGQKNYEVLFDCMNAEEQIFDGRHWDNFPS